MRVARLVLIVSALLVGAFAPFAGGAAAAPGGLRWRLVAGTGQSPEAYASSAPCSVKAIYGWDDEREVWLAWFNSRPEVPGASDLVLMDASAGYWVACAA